MTAERTTARWIRELQIKVKKHSSSGLEKKKNLAHKSDPSKKEKVLHESSFFTSSLVWFLKVCLKKCSVALTPCSGGTHLCLRRPRPAAFHGPIILTYGIKSSPTSSCEPSSWRAELTNTSSSIGDLHAAGTRVQHLSSDLQNQVTSHWGNGTLSVPNVKPDG